VNKDYHIIVNEQEPLLSCLLTVHFTLQWVGEVGPGGSCAGSFFREGDFYVHTLILSVGNRKNVKLVKITLAATFNDFLWETTD